jgi:ketosteroid isomerase-like protein
MMASTHPGASVARASHLPRIALLALGLAACHVSVSTHDARESATPDEHAVREARAAQNRAIVAGDADAVADFWTDDVEIRRGLGQLVVGRPAYRQLFTAAGSSDSALVYLREPTNVTVSTQWPLAYESGTWAGHLGRADGPVVIGGQYSAQWVRRDGRWLIRGEVYVALTCAGMGCSYVAAP